MHNQKSVLGDLIIFTGGTVFSDESDIKIARFNAEMLGLTSLVCITMDDVEQQGAKEEIQAL